MRLVLTNINALLTFQMLSQSECPRVKFKFKLKSTIKIISFIINHLLFQYVRHITLHEFTNIYIHEI